MLKNRSLLFPLFFATLVSCWISCKKSQPQPAPAPTPSNPPAQQPPVQMKSYFLTYIDGTDTILYNTNFNSTSSEDLVSAKEYSIFSANHYVEFSDYNFFHDKSSLNVSLPVDSSRVIAMSLNKKGKTFSVVHPPLGDISFRRLTESVWEEMVQRTDTANYYNKFTSVKYVGNHRFSAFDKRRYCEFAVTGEFKLRVKNDSTNIERDFINGKYGFVFEVLAE